MRMPFPMPRFISMMFGPPRFMFNLELYRRLIRERGPNRPPLPLGNEPEVEFTLGPIDGVLGIYNNKTRRLTVDVLENLMVSVTDQHIAGPEDLVRRFDDRITRTLAHEGGHWHLQKRLGWLPIVEKVAINFILMLVGLFLAWCAIHFYIDHVLLKLTVKCWKASPLFGVSVGLVLTVGYIWMVRNLTRLYYTVWRGLALTATYYICYTERFARGFEKRPDTDPRWDDVIKVGPLS